MYPPSPRGIIYNIHSHSGRDSIVYKISSYPQITPLTTRNRRVYILLSLDNPANNEEQEGIYMFPPSPTTLRGIPKKASYPARKTRGPYGPGHSSPPHSSLPPVLHRFSPLFRYIHSPTPLHQHNPLILFEKANGINIQNMGGLKIHKHAIYIPRALSQAEKQLTSFTKKFLILCLALIKTR